MKRFLCIFLTIVLFSGLSAYAPAESDAALSADEMLAKGQQYESGDGVGQDYTKAMDYFLSAAEAGDAEAMYCYAQMLEDSGGMEAYAAAAAAERYLKCAEAGIPEAMYRYAQKLEKGEGVEKNEELAQEWYGKAKEAGYEP